MQGFMIAKKLLESIPQSIRIIRKLSTESVTESLTLSQLRVLFLIKEGQSQTQMSETLDVSLPAMSKMINCLEKKGLMNRKVSDDRRANQLVLTAKGKKFLSRVSDYVTSELDAGIQKLTKTQREQLLTGILVLDELMKIVKEV